MPLFGFDVASPGMLWWLAAAGVPLVIHLWSRRRYQQMPWAAMEYLIQAIRAARRRIRFQQWLLLLIRLLVVVLVVAAVAEPFLERTGLALVAGRRTHRVLVIDTSYSMGYRPTDKSRFDRAKEVAVRIVEASSQGDGFTLVRMSDPPQVVVAGPVFEPSEFAAEIEDLDLLHTGADLPGTLACVEPILEKARRQHPKIAREEIYFLTDLGRAGWLPPAEPSQLWDQCRRRARRLAERAALIVVDLGQRGADNLAVTAVRSPESIVTTSRPIPIEGELRSFSRRPRRGVPVTLIVGGRQIQKQRVDLPARGAVSVAFSYRFDAPGDQGIEIRLDGDHLAIDNRRFLSLPVRQTVRVLCVDGHPSASPFGGATDFLVRALAPSDTSAGPALVHPDVISDGRLLEVDLAPYDCVFLANVPQFTTGEARALETYLRAGGALVFFLGDQVLADRYNRELAGDGPEKRRLLPARLGPVVTQAPSRLDPLGYRHPIVQAFRGHERAGLLNTPVQKYFRLQLGPKSKAQTVLALENGDPLIVEEPILGGRVVLFATSADPSWTFLPKWPSYVPIVGETLGYLLREGTEQRNLPVGEPLGGTIAPPKTDVPLTILRPDGQTQTPTVHRKGDQSRWSYADTFLSGLYALRSGASTAAGPVFALNVDTAESDLAKLSPDELRQRVWPDVPFVHQTTWEDVDEDPVAQVTRSNPLSKLLLYAVLGLLFAETYLARRFGYPDG